MKLANGEKLPCGSFVRCLVSFGTMQQLVRLEVLDCEIKPILGVPFFASVNPIIGWAKHMVTGCKGSHTMSFEVVPADDGVHVEEVSLR